MNPTSISEVRSRSEDPCKTWPDVQKFPSECCSVPELFNLSLKKKCIDKCSKPENPSFNTWCCAVECVSLESGFVSKGVIDRESVKSKISKVFEDDEKMVKVVSKAVDKCESKGEFMNIAQL